MASGRTDSQQAEEYAEHVAEPVWDMWLISYGRNAAPAGWWRECW